MEWPDGPPEIPEKRRGKLWLLIVAGPLLIASGLYLDGRLSEIGETGRYRLESFNLLDRLLLSGGKTGIVVVCCALGAVNLFGWYWFFKVGRETKARVAAAKQRIAATKLPDEAIPRAPTPPVERPLPPPPRIGDDPFRNPPDRPVMVKKAELVATPTPRASAPDVTNPDDRPKFLK